MKDKKTKNLFDIGKKKREKKKTVIEYICPCFYEYSSEEEEQINDDD